MQIELILILSLSLLPVMFFADVLRSIFMRQAVMLSQQYLASSVIRAQLLSVQKNKKACLFFKSSSPFHIMLYADDTLLYDTVLPKGVSLKWHSSLDQKSLCFNTYGLTSGQKGCFLIVLGTMQKKVYLRQSGLLFE